MAKGLIVTFKGVLKNKEIKNDKNGKPTQYYFLTFDVNGEEITVEGFGDRGTVGAEYDSITMSISQRTWNDKKYYNLFVTSMANPSYMPDKEPNYEQPAEVSSLEPEVTDLPF